MPGPNPRRPRRRCREGHKGRHLSPVFVLWIVLLQQAPFQLFFTIWASLFFGGMLGAGAGVLSGSFSTAISVYGLIGMLAFVGFPLVIALSRAMNYRNTIYSLYPDRLEIEEGFLTIHAKRVMFRDVREVSLRRGVLQRSAGLGSVYLATQATGAGPSWSPFRLLGSGSTFGSGAMITDIAQAEEAYASLRDLLDGTRES